MNLHIVSELIPVCSEAEEVAKLRAELERAREVASEIAQEVEDGRHELELQHHAFERDVTSLQAFGLQVEFCTALIS